MISSLVAELINASAAARLRVCHTDVITAVGLKRKTSFKRCEGAGSPCEGGDVVYCLTLERRCCFVVE